MKKTAARGHTRKHAHATVKHHHKTAKHHPVHHHKTAKAHGHHVHAKAKHPAHAKARGLALGGIACCTAEALAASLRLQGLSVSGDDVLELHRLAGADDDAGAPVLAVLEAASEFGLGGVRLARFAEQVPDHSPLPFGQRSRIWQDVDLDEGDHLISARPLHDTSVILGLELPGPHAVLATPEGWWSWGELWCPWCEFPDAVIEEAWAISWDMPGTGRLPAYLPRSRHSALGTASPGVPAFSMAVAA